jgi:hypothetical protein
MQFAIAESAMRNSAFSVFRNRTSHLCKSNQIKQPAGGCSCAHMLQETGHSSARPNSWLGLALKIIRGELEGRDIGFYCCGRRRTRTCFLRLVGCTEQWSWEKGMHFAARFGNGCLELPFQLPSGKPRKKALGTAYRSAPLLGC